MIMLQGGGRSVLVRLQVGLLVRLLVRLLVGFRSMPVVFVLFWQVTGMGCGLPRGPACGPPPGMVPSRPAGPVSPAVHAYEDQHDEREDDHHERSGAGEVMSRPVHDGDTGQH